MAKVLILDQSKSIRNTLRERLEFERIAAEALKMKRRHPYYANVSLSI